MTVKLRMRSRAGERQVATARPAPSAPDFTQGAESFIAVRSLVIAVAPAERNAGSVLGGRELAAAIQRNLGRAIYSPD
jgi:hypothetical protein